MNDSFCKIVIFKIKISNRRKLGCDHAAVCDRLHFVYVVVVNQPRVSDGVDQCYIYIYCRANYLDQGRQPNPPEATM